MKIAIRLKDRQTGKVTTVWIEAKSHNNTKAIAMQQYGVAYEVL
jgi:hypothetical protein